MPSNPIERTEMCCAEEIERLRKLKGLTATQLASQAGIHIRTLKRILAGHRAYIANIESLATVLGVKYHELVQKDVAPPSQSIDQTTEFSMTIKLEGDLHSPGQISRLVTLTPDVIAALANFGITINSQTSQLSVVERSGDDIKRIIVVVTGMLENGKPFWMYVAVKPSQYRRFLQSQSNGTLDLYNFESYGEVIQGGDDGPLPPDNVTRELAALYNVDYETFLDPVEADRVLKRIAAAKSRT